MKTNLFFKEGNRSMPTQTYLLPALGTKKSSSVTGNGIQSTLLDMIRHWITFVSSNVILSYCKQKVWSRMPAFGWVTRGDSPSSPSFSSPCWSAPSPFTSQDPRPADHLLRPPYGCHGCQGGRCQHAISNRLTGSPRTFKGWPNRPSSPAHLAPPAPPRIVWYNRTLPPTSLLLFVEPLRIAWKRLSSTLNSSPTELSFPSRPILSLSFPSCPFLTLSSPRNRCEIGKSWGGRGSGG